MFPKQKTSKWMLSGIFLIVLIKKQLSMEVKPQPNLRFHGAITIPPQFFTTDLEEYQPEQAKD